MNHLSTEKSNLNKLQIYLQDIKETLLLGYPIIIAQLGIVLMGVADTIQVGEIGAAPLAASGIANSTFFLVIIIGIGILSIISPLLATAKSQDENEQCSLLLTNALRVSVWIALLTILVLFFLTFNFNWFNQKPEVEVLAIPYLYIITISALPMMLFIAARNFTDGLSYTKISMWITFIGVFLNVFLNWVLIHGKLGLPALGLNGAGYATLLTRIFMTVAILYYIFQTKVFEAYLVNFSIRNYHSAITTKILQLGIPAGMQYFFEMAAFVGAAMMAGWIGVHQLAAHQIAINLSAITYMMASGLASAGAIRVGDAQGENSREKTLRAGTSAFVLATLLMTVACLVFIFLNYFLVGLYISDVKVVEIAVILLIIAGFFQLSDGIQCVALGALRGLQDVNIPTFITLFAYWVVGIPFGYFLSFYLQMNVYGIWIGLSVGLTVSAVLLTTRFYWLAGKRYQLKGKVDV